MQLEPLEQMDCTPVSWLLDFIRSDNASFSLFDGVFKASPD
jgi:hypothetical protein